MLQRTLFGESRQSSHADCFSKLLKREQIGCERLSVGELRCAVAALGIEKVEQARGPTLVGVLADVPVLLRNVEIARAKERNHLVVRPQTLIGVTYIGEGLTVCRFLLFSRLGNGEARLGDFALVAVKDRQRNAPVERSRIDCVDVGVVGLNGHVGLTDRPLQFVLTVRSSYALLSRVQVRPVLQCLQLQVFEVALQGLIVERPRYIVVGGNGFVSEQLSQVGERLYSGKLRLLQIGLELQKL